jgi:Ran GTPase-activating protein (RanGAP) involved in mRNA processing and transport
MSSDGCVALHPSTDLVQMKRPLHSETSADDDQQHEDGGKSSSSSYSSHSSYTSSADSHLTNGSNEKYKTEELPLPPGGPPPEPPGEIVEVLKRTSDDDGGNTSGEIVQVLKRTSDDDGGNTSMQEESATNVRPQHDSCAYDEFDAEFELARATERNMRVLNAELELEASTERNKRILLSRLEATLPRGKLSLVRSWLSYCLLLFVVCSLAHYSSLRVQINLTRRNLTPEDAPLLNSAIAANPLLSVLKLSYNCLGDEGANIIGSGLLLNGTHHAHLSVLDLGFNGIGDLGCEALAVKGVVGNYTLQTLYLTGNCIKEKGALAIAGAILHGTAMSKLYLSANRIGPIGMKAISGALAKNDARSTLANELGRQLEELHVSDTGIESEGFLSIPGMLLSNSSLTTLCVCNNNIDDRDMMLLSQALSQNKSVPLKSVRLSFNQITCQGVECFMNAIWGSETLREIKLDNNRIQDRGVQLCAVVLTSIALETLDLAFNRVTTVGIKALMKNLSENSSLHTLSLCGIPIDQNASKAVSYALAYNSSLRVFFLDNCSTGYSSQRHIVAGIVSNRRSSLRLLTGFQLSRKF